MGSSHMLIRQTQLADEIVSTHRLCAGHPSTFASQNWQENQPETIYAIAYLWFEDHENKGFLYKLSTNQPQDHKGPRFGGPWNHVHGQLSIRTILLQHPLLLAKVL